MTDPAKEWGQTEHLLAALVDAVRGGNWQRSGGKGQRPRPVPRPGDGTHTHMGKARPEHEVRDLFNRWRTGGLHQRTTKAVTHGR